ncbi:MAG: hypothetical protein FWE57_08440 [Chitinispirillia bacterium]|nr:hypothetical protein [Chitinispirillia bacterium]
MFAVKKAITLVVLFGLITSAQAYSWQNLYPTYSGLAFGDDKFVAVSTDGLIKVFNNEGADQQPQRFTPHSIYAAAFGDGMFLLTHSIIGDSKNSSLKSADATGWTPVFGLSSHACTKLTFGRNGVFAGIGEGNKIFVYEDEFGWDEQPNTNNLANITYGLGANRYVAVGSTIISASSPMSTWAAASVSDQNLSVAAFGNVEGTSTFVAYGYTGTTVSLYTSSNGTSWNQQSASGIPAGMADMTFGNGTFVAVGARGTTARSANGTSWTAVPSGSDDNFTAVRFGDGVFMALGAGGSVYLSIDNGTSWERKIEGKVMSYSQIAFGGGLYMAVGDSGAIVSSDGKNWTKKYAENLKGLTGVTYGKEMFVAVSNTGNIFISKNSGADDWELVDLTDEPLMGVAFNDVSGNFVAVGKFVSSNPTVMYTSADGITWTRRPGQNIGWTTANMHPTSIAFGSGRFAAGSSVAGRIFHSENNGLSWTLIEVPEAANNGLRVASMNFANGKFTGALEVVASGIASNKIVSSDNGTSWVVFDVPQPVRSVTYASGHYIAVGDGGRVFASTNGQSWSLRDMATNRNLRTVFSGADNVLLAAGASGALLYSETGLLSVRPQSSIKQTARNSARMSVDAQRSIPKLTLSFNAPANAKISFYSLNGKRLYTHHLKAGERSVSLPKRITQNSVVIARYVGDDQKFSQRFQFVR